MTTYTDILKNTNTYLNATNYNLTQLQENLNLIRGSLKEKYSQKEFVEAVNELTQNTLTVSGLSKIENGVYNISLKIAKSIFALFSNRFEANQDNIRFINLLNLFFYSTDDSFDEKEKKEYSQWLLSSLSIDKQILTIEKYKKFTDESVIALGYIKIKNRNINDILLVDIRAALSKNLKSLRLICGGSIKDFAELLEVPIETYKHYDSNKIKLNNEQCIKILSKISKKYSDNKKLPEILSLITNRYYMKFEQQIDGCIKDYALSSNMTENTRENLYANSIVYLSKCISSYNGENKDIDINKAINNKLLKPIKFTVNGKDDTIYRTETPGQFLSRNMNMDHIVSPKEIFEKQLVLSTKSELENDKRKFDELLEELKTFLNKKKLTEKQKKELIELIKLN